MTTTPPPITSVCDGYMRSIYEKNAAAFLALYHPNARVFDTWSVWSYEGTNQRKEVIEKWFSSLGTERVQVGFDRVECCSGADMAVLTARVTYAALSAEGKELRRMENRLTWALKPEGGTLKIYHEHTSVPIGFSDLKGIFGS